ncbi:hypothetical protein EYF80_060716 [Liparis tanakae]|uniref:Uncharacterized protein n=1 Tax=Liparis tanakae TaxID=230148 RepID=A0A4Z2EK55_9TELE|nr:hypothetical protein EYF80_060716 [Liparis tanakae]
MEKKLPNNTPGPDREDNDRVFLPVGCRRTSPPCWWVWVLLWSEGRDPGEGGPDVDTRTHAATEVKNDRGFSCFWGRGTAWRDGEPRGIMSTAWTRKARRRKCGMRGASSH